MKLGVIFLATVFLLIGCSSNKPGVISCEKNEDCPQSYKCNQEQGKCVDIYFPYLGGPRGV